MRKFFEKLLESKLIPSGSELIEPKDFDKKCIRMSDFMNIKNEDEKIGCSRKVIADNANFVCFDSNGAHSANTNEPEFLYRTSNGNRTLCKFRINRDGKKFSKIPDELFTLIRNTAQSSLLKEEIHMPSTEELLNDLKRKTQGGGMHQTQNFAGGDADKTAKAEAAKEKRKANEAARAALIGTISDATKDVALADTTYLQTFNKNTGEVVAHVVDHTACVKYAVKNVFVLDAAGKKQLGPNATAEDKEKFAAGKSIPKSAYLTKPELELREAPVSKSLGVVIKMRKGGLVPESDLRQADKTIQFNKESKDMVTVPLSIDAAVHFIRAYFGGEIKESAKTHGASAGTLKAKTVIKTYKKKGETVTSKKTVNSLVPSNRKKVIMEGNYIPRKSYKTVALSKIVSGDQALKDEAAKSLFSGLFKSTKSYEAKYNILDDATKKLITKKDDGTIASAYTDGTVAMKVKSSFDPTVELTDPAIPMKKFVVNEKSGTESAKYEVYDIKKPSEENKDLDPETNPKYAAIKAEVGMSFEDIVNTCIPTATKKKATGTDLELSNEEALRLEYAGIQGGIPGVEYTGATKDTLKSIDKMIATITL